ncbi:glycosyltransferase [Butyrivibrio sp. DSM 10294]|uniref:glycosyltransferase family 2 protein n=1 Tax=Butyrivibrio sp. DSM 10294 TaxID=2972457 RepID=UPI00234E56A0|nr:glycosyltransferase family 2 protein [Butyrivibrio sp. DSM 10294]MDC7293603.1 glycosyltransferase [Butyrivibrio sp. DSM 10294]
MKKISIIIPCYNAEKWLPDCFRSLQKQTMNIDDLEFIFVDDASNDDGATVEMLMGFEKEYPDSVLIIPLEENLRQGGARNVAHQYASAEYLLCLDSDDILSPKACEGLYKLAKEYDADLLLFGHDSIYGELHYDEVEFSDDNESKIVYMDFKEHPEYRKPYLVGAIGGFGCWGKLFKRKNVLASRACYAEHVVYEEPKFVLPQYLFADNMVKTDSKYYIYRKRFESTMTSQLGKRILDHPKVQLELYEYLLGLGEKYREYKEELDFHFVYSYYLETLFFYAKNYGAFLPLEYFHEMQQICRKLVPNILSSTYIYTESDRQCFETIFQEVISQEQLKGIADRIV